jgi:hypothetical protein
MSHKTSSSKKKSAPRQAPAKPAAAKSRRFVWGGIIVAAIALAAAVFFFNKKEEAPLTLPSFSSENAFALLQRQCDFGPRVPGTIAHDSCRVFLAHELRKYADAVVEQTFAHNSPRLPNEVMLTNLIASFNPQEGRRVLLAAHWDSRPWADQEADSSKRHMPVLGANDGASGVAVLLEIARVLKSHPAPMGVDIILFDGEDFGDPGDSRSYAIGSQHYARNKAPNYNPMFGILLDMVGDRDLAIYQERNSLRLAGGVVDRVWRLAAQLGVREFIAEPRHEIFDDHIPFLEAGIPMIDLIDFDYPHWHTTQDTPDKCSPASLEKVGKVVLAALYDRKGL